MTTISIDIGYDSAETFRAKSIIVGKKKNDDIIYYYGDIKNNKRNAKFMLIGEVQYITFKRQKKQIMYGSISNDKKSNLNAPLVYSMDLHIHKFEVTPHIDCPLIDTERTFCPKL